MHIILIMGFEPSNSLREHQLLCYFRVKTYN